VAEGRGSLDAGRRLHPLRVRERTGFVRPDGVILVERQLVLERVLQLERQLLVERVLELERRRLQRLVQLEHSLDVERIVVVERELELERQLVVERLELVERGGRGLERYKRVEFGRYMGVT
jgi:hypothetical protein